MVGSDGVVNHVCYKMCTTIEGKERLLATKLDSLYKHVGRKRAKANHLGMPEGTIYYYKGMFKPKVS